MLVNKIINILVPTYYTNVYVVVMVIFIQNVYMSYIYSLIEVISWTVQICHHSIYKNQLSFLANFRDLHVPQHSQQF